MRHLTSTNITCWQSVFRHEFVSLIWLRERGCNLSNSKKCTETYIPKRVSDSAYCYCGLMLTDGKECKYCKHQYRVQIVNSVLQKKVTFKVEMVMACFTICSTCYGNTNWGLMLIKLQNIHEYSFTWKVTQNSKWEGSRRQKKTPWKHFLEEKFQGGGAANPKNKTTSMAWGLWLWIWGYHTIHTNCKQFSTKQAHA